MAGAELTWILYFKTLPQRVPEGHTPASSPARGSHGVELPRWQCLCELQHAAEGPTLSASWGKCYHSPKALQRLSQHTFMSPQTSALGFPPGGAQEATVYT